MQTFAMTIRDVLAENFLKLRAATPRLQAPKDIVAHEAATNGTIGRIQKKQSAPSIDTLDTLAKAYGLEAWQMLLPSLQATQGPDGNPVISGLPDWPFELVNKDKYEALSPALQHLAQVRMRDEIDALTAEQASKANGTNNR